MPAAKGPSQWARITKEATWGVYDSGAISANVLWVRIMEDSIGFEEDPQIWEIIAADGGNLVVQGGADRVGFGGRFRIPLYPTQAPKLVPWFASPTGTPPGELDSWTFDWFDGQESRRFTGVRPANAELGTDDRSDFMTLTMDLVAKDEAAISGGLAVPASTVFPSEDPFKHKHLAGLISIAGSTIASIRSARIRFDNTLYMAYHENTRIDRLRYMGRRVRASVEAEYNTPANRTQFTNQTPIAATFGWGFTGPPTAAITFNMQANARRRNRTTTRRFNEDMYERFDIVPLKDATSGLDVATTATYVGA